jgi:ribose transport system ATP-binding protein
LLLAFFGVLRGLSGQILIDGKPVSIASPAPRARRRVGMALIPEDRKTGLMLPLTVRENLSFAALTGCPGHHRPCRGQRLIDDMVACLGSGGLNSTFRSARCPVATSRRSSSPNG